MAFFLTALALIEISYADTAASMGKPRGLVDEVAIRDDDDGIATPLRQRRSLLVQELERVGPLVLGKA